MHGEMRSGRKEMGVAGSDLEKEKVVTVKTILDSNRLSGYP